ncbi:hypothetical protein GGI07_001497 [Coemansia sp. Benny D115]|nr:hypothetical protein GGI07_001497 [Coemansia sp. Benny D115]
MIIVVGLAVTPLMKMRVVVQKRDKIIDFASLKNVKFVLLFGASLFATGGYFMPYYFMPSFAVVSLGLEPSWGANISSLLNAGSILGRIVTGMWADRVGPLNALFTTSLLSTLAILLAESANTTAPVDTTSGESNVYVFQVKMNCGGCSGAIERALKKTENLGEFDVSLKDQTVKVTSSTKTVDEVFEIIKKTGKSFVTNQDGKPIITVNGEEYTPKEAAKETEA